MKFKIFQGFKEKIEPEINDWLEKNNRIKIEKITHAQYNERTIITVWYKNL